MTDLDDTNRHRGEAREALQQVLYEIKRVIVGQDAMLERLLVSLLAGGHVLLEGVPGLAKTLTVKTLSASLGGTYSRIQFTPDLVPADLVGTRVGGRTPAALTPSSVRSFTTSSSPTRSTARPRRCSRRCSRSCRSSR